MSTTNTSVGLVSGSSMWPWSIEKTKDNKTGLGRSLDMHPLANKFVSIIPYRSGEIDPAFTNESTVKMIEMFETEVFDELAAIFSPSQPKEVL